LHLLVSDVWTADIDAVRPVVARPLATSTMVGWPPVDLAVTPLMMRMMGCPSGATL
jgi:hypothetical protein